MKLLKTTTKKYQKTTKKVLNITIPIKTTKTTDKKYHNYCFDNKKSQNCLVVGETPAEKSQCNQ